MRLNVLFRVRFACVVALTSACAETAPSAPVVRFPAPAVLQQIGAQAPPAALAVDTRDPGDGWQLSGPLPMTLAEQAWRPENEMEQVFARAAEAAGVGRFTDGLSCVAREIGRFWLARGNYPGEGAQAHILAACGMTSVQVQLDGLENNVPVPATATHAEMAKAMGPALAERLQTTLGKLAAAPKAQLAAGFWAGWSTNRVIALFAAGTPGPARLEPGSMAPDAEHVVTLQGEVRVDTAYLTAYINRGEHGVAECDVDMAVPLPRFRVLCAMDTSDHAAWVQILGTRPGGVLAHSLAQILARRSPDAVATFQSMALEGVQNVSNGDEFNQVLLRQLNQARAQAGADPVRLAPLQSSTAQQVTAQYFAAAAGQDNQADTIALGLLAGWNVGGMIRNGNHFSFLLPLTRDVSRWLGSALMLPVGRVSLLAPEIEQIAVGTMVGQAPDRLGAVVTGYAFHHGTDHTRDVADLYRRIMAARKRLGLPDIKRLGAVKEAMQDVLAGVHQQAITAGDGLQRVMEASASRYGFDIRGYRLEALSLDAVTIPEDVIKAPELALEIGVTHYKPPGAAWAQYVVFVVYLDPASMAPVKT